MDAKARARTRPSRTARPATVTGTGGTPAASVGHGGGAALHGHPPERDSYGSTAFAEILDRATSAALGRLTGGLSPAALILAYMDWAIHLAAAPGKRLQLVEKAGKKSWRLYRHLAECLFMGDSGRSCITPLPQDKRFAGEAWSALPFRFLSQAFLLQQQWWHNATTEVPGVSEQHLREVNFAARQILDAVAPTNFVLTNPEVLERTVEEGGMNLVRGLQHFLEDRELAVSGRPPVGAENFIPGKDVAVTPGKVIHVDRLIELIQYAPDTDEVHREPVLIVPAWIMKYYILDLSPQNSLVRYLRSQGHTVFMISWKNPDPDDRDLGMEDYLDLGVREALDAVGSIVPDARVNAVGYCLGGTLAAIAAAALAREGDDRLATLTLLATETDFTEPGELELFIDESQLSFLQNMMWEQGFLDTKQMAGAFQMLRSNDLIWSRLVHDYLMGKRRPMIDLMAWNADATRLPYRMHTEYLHRLFLHNDLAEGRYRVRGEPITLTDIRAPIFAVGTEWDHVVPWRSAFKIHLLTDTDVTFLLTSGGHNAGIVSEPGRPRRHYRMLTRPHGERHVDPEGWLEMAPLEEGSWWPAWSDWLIAHSEGKTPPPPLGNEIYPPRRDAPGQYVFGT